MKTLEELQNSVDFGRNELRASELDQIYRHHGKDPFALIVYAYTLGFERGQYSKKAKAAKR